jgi:quinol monooxygenase YgiN
MSVVEIIRLPVAAANAEALSAAVLAARDGYLAPPRCEDVRILRAVSGEELVLLVTWTAQSAHDEAAAEPATQAFLDDVGRLAAGPPHITFCTPSWPQP